MQKVFIDTLWKVDILSCFLNLLVNENFNIFIITDKIWSNKINASWISMSPCTRLANLPISLSVSPKSP